MYYDIAGLCHRNDITLGAHGFMIKLYPKWAEVVENSGITQKSANKAIENMGRAWLDACGYDAMGRMGVGEYSCSW